MLDDASSEWKLTTFELDASSDVAIYNVVMEPTNPDLKGDKYIYKVNAKTGLIRYRVYYDHENREDEEQIGLYHDRGDASDETTEQWNRYWEAGFVPDGQLFYENMPIIHF